MSVAFWICAAVTLISAAVSFGYAVAGVRGSAGAARTASLYALSRSVALLAVAAVAPVTGSIAFVAAAACAMVIVQGIDAGIGAGLRDRVKTIGPAATAIVNAAALAWLLLG